MIRLLLILIMVGAAIFAPTTTTSTTTTTHIQSGLPAGIYVYTFFCVGAAEPTFIHAPVSADWDAGPSANGPGAEEAAATRPATAKEVPFTRCRFSTQDEAGFTFTLADALTGEQVIVDGTDSWNSPVFQGMEPGTYSLTIDTGATSYESPTFLYVPGADPAVNLTVYLPLAEQDWKLPTTAPDVLAEVSIIPHACDGSEVTYRQSMYGIEVGEGGPRAPEVNPATVASQTPMASASTWRNCTRAEEGDYQFALIPVGETQSVPLFWTPDGRIISHLVPMGEYELYELTTGTTVGAIHVEAGQDIIFHAPAP